MNVLHQGDCLEIMPTLPAGSIDLILCDLPYGTTQCAWDSAIPFSPLWEQYIQLIKENGVIVLSSAQPFTSSLIASNLTMFKYEWIWEKSRATGHLNAKKMPMRAHENICVFYKKSPTYNPIKTTGHNRKVTSASSRAACVNRSNKKDSALYGKERIENATGYDSTERFPRSVLNFPSGKMNQLLHPTQKPVALMEYLIRTYTNEGDTVLDNCMGSGTTGVACVNTKRDFIGIEQESKYFDIAKTRIESAEQDLKFDLFKSIA